MHGVWDASSKFVGPYIAPHTNLTEINIGLQLLWRAGVQANKVVLGQGWVGIIPERHMAEGDLTCHRSTGDRSRSRILPAIFPTVCVNDCLVPRSWHTTEMPGMKHDASFTLFILFISIYATYPSGSHFSPPYSV